MPVTLTVPDFGECAEQIRTTLLPFVIEVAPDALQIYTYRPDLQGGPSPLILIENGGAGVENQTARAEKTIFRAVVSIWVVRVNSAMTEAQSEAQMNSLERRVRQWYHVNRRNNAVWQTVVWEGIASVDEYVALGGSVYLLYELALLVTMHPKAE